MTTTSGSSNYPDLFTPIQVGTHTIQNRIGMSALTRNRADGTYPTDLMKEYYLQRVQGGTGLIVTEGILVSRQGTEWQNAPGIWNQQRVVGWKNITDAVHLAEGKILAQLWHPGRTSHPDAPQQKLAGVPVYAPSAIAARGGIFRFLPGEPGYVAPTELDETTIWKIIGQFKQAAINAKAAGFDGVELQGANGLLVAQFLDNTSNTRSDKWGGSVENRARFGLEVLKSFKEVFGENVGMKISPCGGYNDVGMPLSDTLETFSYFLREADRLGLAYITLVRYHPNFDMVFDGVNRSTNFDVLDSLRSSITNSKVFLNAGVTPEEGQQLISEGKIDGIMVGFNMITHPDYVKRVKTGRPLNNAPNFPLLQRNVSDEDWHSGYTDYPLAKC
ncbi:flavoprotein NADH-dependent oxidoreductase [Crepidotus variabilis]|uniref:Flavoprotein NADH-dependent oxidoreductase n=1 Tax=Crepidotus variabilis TaxID=179855 RepID=A0A9P6E7F2_9AGAR|nr:flavoprotein NADH-dependent oxidoreductase [Crepidotus variabilis]